MTPPVFRVLGALEVCDRTGMAVSLPRRKQRALLALMLFRAGTTLHPEEIVDALWGERPPSSARANLHSYVYGLRRIIGQGTPIAGSRLKSTSAGYRLDLLPVECDASLFERLAASGRQALHAGAYATAAQCLARALGLWRGAMLTDLADYDWLLPYCVQFEQARLAALEDLINARLLLDQHADLVAELAAATARYPLRERLWGQYMVALHRAGHRAEALAAYARLQGILRAELGVDPGSPLNELRRRIHANDPRV